jgi:hypothetical protein
MDPASAGGSMITMLITFFLLMIPIAIVNAVIAKRKGRSRALYGWLSIIPLVGYYLLCYLISLPDKDLIDKIDRILAKTEQI